MCQSLDILSQINICCQGDGRHGWDSDRRHTWRSLLTAGSPEQKALAFYGQEAEAEGKGEGLAAESC